MQRKAELLYHPLTGRPVGSVEFKGRPYEYIDQAKKWAAEFLSKVTTQEKGNMATAKREAQGLASPKQQGIDTNEKTNMVFLAGIVQVAKAEEERLFFTLDVGMKQWIPCSVYKNPEIQEKLKGLYKGDFVKVKALLRPWSKKNGENWDRGLNVEITEVKNLVKGSGAPSRTYDDNIPF